MAFLKKPLFIQNINPRAFLTILIWLIIAWILARPLKGLGENAYLLAGSLTSHSFQLVSQAKTNIEELIQSKRLVKEQSEVISLLKIKINHLENQVKETENIKSLLNLKKGMNYKTISASIIGRSADNWHKQIILDRGANHKIMLGDVVLTSKGVVGQIVEVDKESSVVQLISDLSYRLGCKIARKNVIGILSGSTNSVGLLEFIPVGTDVNTGDLVITSGIGTNNLSPTYPAGHPIGKIKKVSKKKNKASDLYIEVKLSEDLSSLSNVLVFSPD